MNRTEGASSPRRRSSSCHVMACHGTGCCFNSQLHTYVYSYIHRHKYMTARHLNMLWQVSGFLDNLRSCHMSALQLWYTIGRPLTAARVMAWDCSCVGLPVSLQMYAVSARRGSLFWAFSQVYMPFTAVCIIPYKATAISNLSPKLQRRSLVSTRLRNALCLTVSARFCIMIKSLNNECCIISARPLANDVNRDQVLQVCIECAISSSDQGL